ncbi:MAG: nuclear transport factor 2 family protein [Planctomycetales bacterium]|nr:nuclear transport factor 2 family protein [Planctomycetales bacterium]
MRYICLGFIDENQWSSLPAAEGQQLMESCFEYDNELRRSGNFAGGIALDTAKHAVTLSMANGRVEVTDGPYAETKEVLGGILMLEARDMNHAISLMSRHPGVGIGPFEIRPADEQTIQQFEAFHAAKARDEVLSVVHQWGEAFCQRDLDQLESLYADDFRIFDAIPPFQEKDFSAYRARIEGCLPYFPDTFSWLERDVEVSVTGQLALVSRFFRWETADPSHPASQTWLRHTCGLRPESGGWRIFHDHVSVPFDPETVQALFTLTP